jgi:secreted trypsin-like serine protease
MGAGIGLSACERRGGESPEPAAERGSKPIVGGVGVAPGALAQVVGITYRSEATPRCTGTLIAANIVLTAAHCVCAIDGNGNVQDLRPTNVYVGDDPRRVRRGSRPYYQVVDRRIALRCNRDTSRTGVDIAVLKLNTPVRNVDPVDFAPDSLTDRATGFRIVGFGATNLAGTAIDYRKREARVPSLSNACAGTTGGRDDSAAYGCQPGEEIVAGRTDTPDTCFGDSGGPLLVSSDGDGGTASSNALMIAGVTSRSVRPAASHCGAGGVYERLRPPVRVWIDAALRSLNG